MSAEFEIRINNKDAVLEALHDQCITAMEACGLAAEAYAVQNIDAKHIVDTGNLKASITHAVDSDDTSYEMHVGTNVEYAVYNELGTGKYYSGGRDTPWAYQDAKGNWHRTSGMQARPFLKPAVADHTDSYKQIIENYLKS